MTIPVNSLEELFLGCKRFRKTTPIRAVQLTRPTMAYQPPGKWSPGGLKVGNVGDWAVEDPVTREVSFVSDADFRAHYWEIKPIEEAVNDRMNVEARNGDAKK